MTSEFEEMPNGDGECPFCECMCSECTCQAGWCDVCACGEDLPGV